MIIKNLLPEHPRIYDLIKKRTEEQRNKFNHYLPTCQEKRSGGFDWSRTSENVLFWEDIDKGNYSVFYEKYPEEEWIPKAGDWIVATSNYTYFKKGMVVQINDCMAYPLSNKFETCFDISHYIGNACYPPKSICRKALPSEIPTTETELTSLPEKWCVQRTDEHGDFINEWFRENKHGTPFLKDNTFIYTLSDNKYNSYYKGYKNDKEHTIITFEQFKKWVDIPKEEKVEPKSETVMNTDLLEEAFRLYPIGTNYYDVGTTYERTVQGKLQHYTEITDQITDGRGGSVYEKGEWAEILKPMVRETTHVCPHDFKVGERVLYDNGIATILGFTRKQDCCVIDSVGCHNGDNPLYWYDEFSNAIPYVKGNDRIYAHISYLKKLTDMAKIDSKLTSLSPLSELVLDTDRPSKPDYVAKVKQQIQMIPVKKIKVRNN